jgi:carboxyl-terminal processing protease
LSRLNGCVRIACRFGSKVSAVRLSFRRAAGILFIGLLIEAAFVAGLLLAPTLLPVSPLKLGGSNPTGLLGEAWDAAERSFYGQVPSNTVRTYGAIRGMIQSFNDPYTAFFEPPATQQQSQQLAGKFGGIGSTLRRETDGRIVLSPFPDRPAAQAGVQEGDVLVKVDAHAITPDLNFDAISQWLRGEVGTPVTIEIVRATRSWTFTITRAEISVPSVTWRVLGEAPSIGYVALSIFAQPTKDELVHAIDDVRSKGATKLILDLRDNGGGLLDSAVDVASQFIDGVVVIEARRTDGDRNFNANAIGAARDVPLVVLVNGNTASASEIVAGAIQDRQRGKLIGDQTYGKGSVQNILPLSDGSSLHVTVAQWLTPDRRQISGKGLTPDVVVGRTPDDVNAGRDPQLAKAIEELTQ